MLSGGVFANYPSGAAQKSTLVIFLLGLLSPPLMNFIWLLIFFPHILLLILP